MIKPYVSPVSSPMLLVRKIEDEGFVLISALSRVTIIEKFSIQTIDKLIKELIGVIIFSQLVLKSR